VLTLPVLARLFARLIKAADDLTPDPHGKIRDGAPVGGQGAKKKAPLNASADAFLAAGIRISNRRP
jgi:hypothetical protein